ncbi:MAG: methionyl-tRNA formyltransferase [Candidatus Omnitrophica bacterium]|nr:methionyl-tRNA formyltransferase [Candidatus Omnitrophota bacterium]MBU2044613.1 methionyl-tRNA formyltransferase [Candidatus Omnitrophota bacterium]MBU2265497.1 methionyl-tRNA formyltransferase [Candidatus Omnitrophota bacterium]
MNFVYFGSSEFSRIVLAGLCQEGFLPYLVVTKPDKPKGRGLKLAATEVSIFADSKNIPSVKPQTLRDKNFRQLIQAKNPEYFIVVDYGNIIPEDLLSLPGKFVLGLHPSLLPLYRGPAPIEYTLLNGDRQTGLTIFKVDQQVDSGEIIFQKKVPVELDDDHFSLSLKLAREGAVFLVEGLRKIGDNKYKLNRQSEDKATFTHKFRKSDGTIDWQKPAEDISNQVRAMVGWPSAHTHYQSRLIKILKAAAIASESQLEPGQIIGANREGIAVACGKGILLIKCLKPEGKKAIEAWEFVSGYRLKAGERLGK